MRAKNIVQIVHQCQLQETVSPISLLNLWTSDVWHVTDQEKMLRARVLELSEQTLAGEDTLAAISNITVTLQAEGLFEELVSEHIERDILVHIKSQLSELLPLETDQSINTLLWYHTLLLKTGGCNQWTLRRLCGETQVTPYHPIIIEALKQNVEVKMAVAGEFLKPQVQDSETNAGEGLMAFAWRKLSVLEFLHGLSQADYEVPTSQATVSVISSQEPKRTFRESTEEDEEVDDIFVNRKGESFIIINGDLRKLYSKRPPRLQTMTFAQFVISYYRLKHGQKATVDPESDVGADSGEQIIGGEGRVPLYVKLSNKVILKKRSGKSRPVPLLLGSSLDAYGERMLFKPWRQLDELFVESTEAEKLLQSEVRLALFPTSTFSRSAED